MASLLSKIQEQIVVALKGNDKIRVSVLRLVVAGVKNREIAKRPETVSDDDVISVIAKEIKDREEGIKIYENAGKIEAVEALKSEMAILREFVPEIGDEEVEKLVAEAIEKNSVKSISEMGKIMGYVMPKVSGRASSDKVRETAAKLLSK